MPKSKLSKKLDQKTPTKKPAFSMREPNDDLAAFGWSLDRLRYPSKTSTKTDVWPGRSIFEVAEAKELYEQYGFNIDFVNPKFVQVVLDNSPKVRAAADACAAAKYNEATRAHLRQVIDEEFKAKIIPEILSRFKKISPLVADYYAAKISHLLTFGADSEYA